MTLTPAAPWPVDAPDPGRILLRVPSGAGTGWAWGASPLRIHQTDDPGQVLLLLREIAAEVGAGRTAAGFLAYEAAGGLDPVLMAHPPVPGLPLIWFGIYEALVPCAEPAWQAVTAPPALAWMPEITWEEYRAACIAIHEAIAAGNTYQVNYTFRQRAVCDPAAAWPLFAALMQSQPVAHAAFLDIGSHVIASGSPELFFQREGEHVVTRPMKGTRPRGRYRAEDQRFADALAAAEKDRAENVMIVDMLRNDLGRIADTGSVQVPRLFTVEKYRTVWQMTSEVTAKSQASIPELLKALFPCASVTGAPKAATMRHIAQLETSPRGVYCGAIGCWGPGEQASFNVAIRTLVLDRAAGQIEYGTGSGIVWDSDPAAEYAECLAKTRALDPPPPSFQLVETILWHPRRGYWLLDRHLQRLQDSAAYFGYPCDPDAIREALTAIARLHPATEPRRVRLLLDAGGATDITRGALPAEPAVWRVRLADAPVDERDPFLFHKTTHRAQYAALRASHPDCEEVICWNRQGELTEGLRSNLLLRLEGRYLTPPVESGCLGGTYRQHLLARGLIGEQVLTPDDLRRADRIYCLNALRGRVPCVLQD